MHADVATVTHEILHALFFHPILFRTYPINFLNEPFFEQTSNLTFLTGTHLINEARHHFACPNLQRGANLYFLIKVPLENNGGQGSLGAHFERVVFGNETMVAEDTQNTKFSKFTLAVAADSGWFEADFSSAEHMDWGENAGCEFANGAGCGTSSSPEICQSGEIMKCSRDFKAKMSCSKTVFTGKCSIAHKGVSCSGAGQGSFYETFGNESKCHLLLVNENTFSGCFEIKCANDHSHYSIVMNLENQKVDLKCEVAGQKLMIPGYSMLLECEDPGEYCSASDPCGFKCGDR